MEGFTKGSWVAVDKRPYSDGFSIFSDNQYIAFVGDSDGATNYKENAQLIAAAPDLLEALQLVMSIFHCPTIDSTSEEYREWYEATDIANAAIVKALGQ